MSRIKWLAIGALLCSCSLQTGLNKSPSGASSPARASPSQYVVLPDLSQMSEADAREKLVSAGITRSISTKTNSGCEWDMDIEAGWVCGQHPAAGQRVSTRSPVVLQLAKPTTTKEHTKMPDVLGWDAQKAKAHLLKLGFQKVTIDISGSADCKPNVVCRQNPLPGTRAVYRFRKQLFVRERPPNSRPKTRRSDAGTR